MNVHASKKLTHEYIRENLMGPNALLIAQELCENLSIPQNALICDLGSGTGLTSMIDPPWRQVREST